MLDPYLLWAELTDYRDVARDARGRVGVIVECKGSVAQLQKAISAGELPGVELPLLYRGGVVSPHDIRYCTAWVERSRLQALAARVQRFKLGMAVDAPEAPVAGPQAPRPRRHCLAPVVIGVVDDFVAFAHPEFADKDGKPRVRFVWSQAARPPDSRVVGWWQAGRHLGYGHELVVATARGRPLAGAYPAVLPRATHGTHVADLAAGHWPENAAVVPDIVAVHLPRRGVDDTSGSALKMQTLDALHYIVERAGPQAGVVVNISYGTMAGAHDGASILERAFDELIALRRGQLHLVLPAGNSFEDDCHAVLRLTRAKPKCTLWWKVLPDDATPSFVEVWLPDRKCAQDIRVRVLDPAGCSSGWCGVDSVFPPRGTPSSQVGVAVIYLGEVADSPRGTMILVALAATAGAGPARASAGLWQIELAYAGAADAVELHAWIERDDTLPGRPPSGRQSTFVEAPGVELRAAGSFNSIANGERTIVVGGYVASTGAVAGYSGSGPTRGRRSGPSLLAPSDESQALAGLRAAGTAEADTVRIGGTSVAAPQVTREIARLLSLRAKGGPPRMTLEECLDALVPRARGPGRDEPPVSRQGRGRLARDRSAVPDPATSAPAAVAAARARPSPKRRSRRAPGPSSAG
jgi:subtilisin family serine protease